MANEIFEKAKAVLAEIEAAKPDAKEALEQFRIKYIGSKGIVKSLMSEMRNIPNEMKRDYGQLVNSVKQGA
ncbi:MAG: phenylalanyl-tRNA synthetase alpha chain, partial [Saprospiraceae bacterium]